LIRSGVAGDEVAQLYLGAPENPPAGAQFAVRAPAPFERVPLAPGQAKSLTLLVEPRRLQYWSVTAGKWQFVTGARIIYVGASSRDIRLQAELSM